MQILLLVSVFSFLTNCSKNKIDLTRIVHIEIPKLKSDDVVLNVHKTIELQTDSISFIGNLSKLRFSQKGIYILDAITQAIMVFDTTGSFQFKIFEKGKGPGEFASIKDFDVDRNGHIYLFDNHQKKVIEYLPNGKYIKEYRINFLASSFSILTMEQWVFETGNHKNKELDNPKIIIWNPLNKDVVYTLLQQREKIDAIGTSRIPNSLYKSENQINYNLPFTNQIYSIKDSGIVNSYWFDFKERNTPEEFIRKTPPNKRSVELFKTKYISHIRNIYENNEYLTFEFSTKEGSFALAYNKNSNSYKVFRCSLCDKFNGAGVYSLLGIHNDYFLASVITKIDKTANTASSETLKIVLYRIKI